MEVMSGFISGASWSVQAGEMRQTELMQPGDTQTDLLTHMDTHKFILEVNTSALYETHVDAHSLM